MDRRIQDPSFLRDYWRGLTNQGKLIEVAMEERGPTGKVRKAIVVADTSQSRETITLWDASASGIVIAGPPCSLFTGASDPSVHRRSLVQAKRR